MMTTTATFPPRPKPGDIITGHGRPLICVPSGDGVRWQELTVADALAVVRETAALGHVPDGPVYDALAALTEAVRTDLGPVGQARREVQERGTAPLKADVTMHLGYTVRAVLPRYVGGQKPGKAPFGWYVAAEAASRDIAASTGDWITWYVIADHAGNLNFTKTHQFGGPGRTPDEHRAEAMADLVTRAGIADLAPPF